MDSKIMTEKMKGTSESSVKEGKKAGRPVAY